MHYARAVTTLTCSLHASACAALQEMQLSACSKVWKYKSPSLIPRLPDLFQRTWENRDALKKIGAWVRGLRLQKSICLLGKWEFVLYVWEIIICAAHATSKKVDSKYNTNFWREWSVMHLSLYVPTYHGEGICGDRVGIWHLILFISSSLVKLL